MSRYLCSLLLYETVAGCSVAVSSSFRVYFGSCSFVFCLEGVLCSVVISEMIASNHHYPGLQGFCFLQRYLVLFLQIDHPTCHGSADVTKL